MERPNRFGKSLRIRSRREFSRVFEVRVRESRGPLTMYGVPNYLPHARLGLSVGRPVGIAPRRNRIKRLLREAFRLHQHELTPGYDLVIVVRPHAPLSLPEYEKGVRNLFRAVHAAWQKRPAADVPPPPPPPPGYKPPSR